ncbi:hypothetical protein F5B21DRAFT_503939 [Xylaria acuta]|nr:hypothetical protein F5B21DRAFT_503939 [Xylaria acuta]
MAPANKSDYCRSIMYSIALILMIAAYSSKDLRDGGPNLPFFVAVGHEFGVTDIYFVYDLFNLFIDGRKLFLSSKLYGGAVNVATRSSPPHHLRPLTALAYAVDVLLSLGFRLMDGRPGPQDNKAFKDRTAYFNHKTFCKISHDMGKLLSRSGDNNLRFAAHTAATHSTAAENVVFLAKSVAETLVKMNLLNNFRDITICLDIGTVSR